MAALVGLGVVLVVAAALVVFGVWLLAGLGVACILSGLFLGGFGVLFLAGGDD